MPYVNLNINDEQLNKATQLAQKLKVNRSVYLRQAIDFYNERKEREILAQQFKHASEKCREESLAVCREFEHIDLIPD